jgi:hypothetical protein
MLKIGKKGAVLRITPLALSNNTNIVAPFYYDLFSPPDGVSNFREGKRVDKKWSYIGPVNADCRS